MFLCFVLTLQDRELFGAIKNFRVLTWPWCRVHFVRMQLARRLYRRRLWQLSPAYKAHP